MKALERRKFISLLGKGLLLSSMPGLYACQPFEPKPFVTGRTVTPPQGCTELRQRDPQGEC